MLNSSLLQKRQEQAAKQIQKVQPVESGGSGKYLLLLLVLGASALGGFYLYQRRLR